MVGGQNPIQQLANLWFLGRNRCHGHVVTLFTAGLAGASDHSLYHLLFALGFLFRTVFSFTPGAVPSSGRFLWSDVFPGV